MSFSAKAPLAAVAFLALLSFGCGKSGDVMAASKTSAADSPALGAAVNMTDANAKEYFVRGVVPELQANAWRWVNQRPELQFRLRSTQNQKFFMEFAIPEVTFEVTGPVTVTYSVNGTVIDRVKYAEPGNLTYEKAVPADLLKADSPNLVAAEVDKAWVSPKDKTRLGFILVRAGFRS